MSNHYVVFTGGRDFKDKKWVDELMQILVWIYGDDLRVIHGAARGADKLVDNAARALGVRVKDFPVSNDEWKRNPRTAGFIRNAAMASYVEMCRDRGHTVQCIALPGGNGTANMVTEADRRGIPVDAL